MRPERAPSRGGPLPARRRLIVARIDFGQQLALADAVVVLDMNRDHGAVDPGTERINMTVDLRVIRGLIGLQIIPREPRARTDDQNQHRQEEESGDYSFVRAASAGGIALVRPAVGLLYGWK